MVKKSKVNVKLFKKIIKFVEADLRRLEMNFYGVKKDTDDADSFAGSIVDDSWAACGTKACCAGWAVLLSTPKSQWNTLFKKSGEMRYSCHYQARKLLGLNGRQAQNIFTGEALYQETSAAQLASLRDDINRVLEEEDIKERV